MAFGSFVTVFGSMKLTKMTKCITQILTEGEVPGAIQKYNPAISISVLDSAAFAG